MKDNNKLYFTLNKEKKQVKFTEKDSLEVSNKDYVFSIDK